MALCSTLLCAAIASLFVCPAVLRADKIQIISEPPGANVEVDGKTGITPCEMDFPASYFHDPHTLLSKRLNHPIVARFTLEGYLPKELPLTEGPLEWVSASGHKRYEYWLFRSSYFRADLEQRPKRNSNGASERAGILMGNVPCILRLRVCNGPILCWRKNLTLRQRPKAGSCSGGSSDPCFFLPLSAESEKSGC